MGCCAPRSAGFFALPESLSLLTPDRHCFLIRSSPSSAVLLIQAFLSYFQYINAETSAGGIAHWATSEVEGSLRTNATDWRAAWQAYIEGIIRVTKPYEISVGGPVIGK